MHQKPCAEVAFVTDVEGNLNFLSRWVLSSRVLVFEAGRLEFVHDHAYFVYGGDVMDKGPGGVRLARLLVSLKRRYPERVRLLVGNRDLNKLRFTAELGEADMARPVDDIPCMPWDTVCLREHLERVATASGLKLEEVNTRRERLRYMLQHTLGCPDSFELRREEVALERSCELAEVTDDEVVEHFVDDVTAGRGGALREYLEHADVAAILGTTLFVHGAVDRMTLGFVPADDTRFEVPKQRREPRLVRNVEQWVDELNSFLRRGLSDHEARPDWDGSRSTRGGEAIMAIQCRPAVWGRSVVSNAYSTGGVITCASARSATQQVYEQMVEDPLAAVHVLSDPMDPEVAACLLEQGVRRVVVGHKPSGDSPAVLSSCYTGVEVISADTSFSDTDAADNRGVAVPGVLLQGPLEANSALIYGTLRDGRRHEARLACLGGAGPHDEFVGTELVDGWWVKARLVSGAYLLCRGNGRSVEYRDEHLTEAHRWASTSVASL